MKNDEKIGFTLSEVLITLSIVGVLAAIVLPGLIKDTMNRSRISALKSTIANINDAINSALVEKRVMTLNETDFYLNPVKFLKSLEAKETAEDNSLFESSYKTIQGSATDTSTMDASGVLKNGVTIGIKKGDATRSYMYVDTNGKKGPNIHGIDYFVMAVTNKNSLGSGAHAGDIGCVSGSTTSLETCKTSGGSCFCVLERSGFDYKYLDYSDIY